MWFLIRRSDPRSYESMQIYNEIVAKKAYESLLKKINKEIEEHQAIIKREVIVDASITVRLFAPKGLLPT
ncbi:MAG: hypothetical protein ACMUEL_01065 [Flavobacteriales bacterium Tduv]